MLKSMQNLSWRALSLVTWLSALVYVALEWLFFMTKPSALSILSMVEKVRIALFAFALLAFLGYGAVKLMQLVARVWHSALVKAAALLVPAALQGSLAFLLIDNFTYTLFKFGVATSTGALRAVYLLLYLALLVMFYREVVKQSLSLERVLASRPRWLEAALVLGTAALLVVTYRPPIVRKPAMAVAAASRSSLPNIILLTPDGLNAEHMSLYGYERDTTPFLKELAAYSLVGDNHYSNAGNTLAGLIAALASKHPSTTRVLFAPSMLRGEAMYQHLPYILKLYGYTNYHFSHPYYADVTERGLLDGFDFVNGLNFQQSRFLVFFKTYTDLDSATFLYELLTRLSHRLKHITFIKPMTNYRALLPTEVPSLSRSYYSDAQKLEQTLAILDQAQGPVFVHVHWMTTHPVYPADKPPHFLPEEQVFSVGKDIQNQTAFDMDFYDDTIYGFDKAVQTLVTHLTERGLYDNTILIITSDHGLRSDHLKRVPLLIHFPNDAHVARIHTHTQNVDIAPTVLDAMGLPIPAWMEGQSLLDETLQTTTGDRPVFTIAINTELLSQPKFGTIVVEEKPPFYSIGEVALISCNVAYRLKLSPPEWIVTPLPDSTLSCDPIGDAEAYRRILDHLRERGYDLSSLAGFAP